MPKISAQNLDTSVKSNGMGRKVQAEAPDMNVIDDLYQDERKVLVEMAKKELGEKANGMHFCFQNANAKEELWTRKGYVPVMMNGKPVTDGMGDPLTMIDERIPQRKHNAVANLAYEQVNEALTVSGQARGVRDADGKVHSPISMGD